MLCVGTGFASDNRGIIMGIFSRFKDIVNSNINSLLDKAEDPEKMLRLMIQEMEDTLIELKSNCAALMAEGIRKERKLDEQKKTLSRWENRALLALEKGREDLAREALQEKRNVQNELDSMISQIKENLSSVDEAKKEIETLETKLKEAKNKLSILKEKKERAEMERKANDAARKDMNAHFDAMEEKIDRMTSWNNLSKSEKTAEEKFQDFEKDDEIEKELEELKKRIEK